MANKMLIDATHPEETRVVVVRGNRVEEFDFESANRRQLRGNIYLAKVTRVEPSLQAAFVEYGGNRHGFLAFSEIHPDYYQIPMADRQALIAEEERAQREADDEVDRRAGRRRGRGRGAERRGDRVRSAPVDDEAHEANAEAADAGEARADAGASHDAGEVTASEDGDREPVASPETAPGEPVLVVRETIEEQAAAEQQPGEAHARAEGDSVEAAAEARSDDEHEHAEPSDHESGDEVEAAEAEATDAEARDGDKADGQNGNGHDENGDDEEVVESVGGDDALEEATERMPRIRRQYKIQEVIKRRQIMLVQVVKEERGTKGAALTTYLSLAGRYSVLMPNTARGGGISRKITSAPDRKRLKEIAGDLEVPEGMGVILRTAGANRTKAEIKRDFEYLLRVWETVRDLTLKSTAPTLVYEEGSLIKRSIRDLYNKDIDEVLVAGDDAYREAKEFMRTLMPSHAKNVKAYRDTQPVFTRYGIESQLDAMFSPVVQLKSGGYVVINQAEALVAIDVNSGRATREHHIEDTALKTNVEAADEIARQLRLRDLAGLIVIDFIDMDEKRNNRTVERRLKEALKQDRARIQVGRISHFGLLEMSRQRIRTSVLESSTDKCTQCGGTGHVRSVGSVALQLLRSLEEMLIKIATHNLVVRTRPEVALYVLNHKRAHLRELETRFRIAITINADATISGQQPFVIDRGEQVHSVEAARAIAAQPSAPTAPVVELDEDEAEAEAEAETAEETATEPTETEAEAADDGDQRRGRKRRRRRRGSGEAREAAEAAGDAMGEEADVAPADAAADDGEDAEERAGEFEPEARGGDARGDGERRRRRRGRRGGRRNKRDREGPFQDSEAVEPELTSAVADFDQPYAMEQPQPDATAPPHAVPPEGAPQPYVAQPDVYQADTSLPAPETQPDAPRAREDSPRAEPVQPVPITPVEPPAASEPEHPRRRSTVREPAPFAVGSGEAPVTPVLVTEPQPITPAPDPVEAESAEQSGQPRRTGWWAKRLMGGQKN
jgi:ribonuclease E